jgi:hypothetical protein
MQNKRSSRNSRWRSKKHNGQASGYAMRELTQNPPSLPVTSSEPLPIPEEQKTLFQEVLSLFEQNRIPYAVAGAFALRTHTGICRDTKDLDILMFAILHGAFVRLRSLFRTERS